MKVFITGISKGIGRALTREMVADGHQVWGVARNATELEELQIELGADKLKYTVSDISNYNNVKVVLDELASAGFCPDIVYLNAGLYSTTDPSFSSIEHAEELLKVNMQAPMWFYNGFMVSVQKPKCFVLISSLFALLSDPINPAYAASKAGVSAAFKAYALQNKAVDVKIVYLGPVNTHVNKHAENKGGALLADPTKVANYLAKVYDKRGLEFVHPFTAWTFYQIFRLLPMWFYKWVMLKVRR